MKRGLSTTVVIGIALCIGALAVFAEGPNFAGTWELDKSKSELTGRMANIEGMTLVVTQDAKQITVDTKIAGAAEQGQPFTYKLDGGESSMDITGRMPAKATLKAKWQSDVLELSQDRAMSMNGNDFTVTIKDHWQLSPDGKMLTVHRTTDSPRGTQESKLVFSKK